jgi:hypothetical protein
LVDTAFDIVFVAITYASGVVWLAIICGIGYVYTFFDKIHSSRKLFGLLKDLKAKRFEGNLLAEPIKQIQFYSSCASISAYPMAETLGSYNLRSINLLRRVLIFECAHVTVQKLLFLVLKIAYFFMESVQNRSEMVNYAIPMNLICWLLTVLFIFLKFRDLKERKSTDNSDPAPVDIKKFHSQVTPTAIKFLQSERGNLDRLQGVI